jgi:hypothetical protein
VSRIRKGATADGGAAGVIMRIFGVMEIETSMCMTATHVPGVENTLADELSREWLPDPLPASSPFYGYTQLTFPPQICAAFWDVLRGRCRLQHWLLVPGRNTVPVGGNGSSSAVTLPSLRC